MAQIGRYTEQLSFLILKEYPKDRNYIILDILSLVKRHSTDVTDASYKRVLAYSIIQYSIIRRIAITAATYCLQKKLLSCRSVKGKLKDFKFPGAYRNLRGDIVLCLGKSCTLYRMTSEEISLPILLWP